MSWHVQLCNTTIRQSLSASLPLTLTGICMGVSTCLIHIMENIFLTWKVYSRIFLLMSLSPNRRQKISLERRLVYRIVTVYGSTFRVLNRNCRLYVTCHPRLNQTRFPCFPRWPTLDSCRKKRLRLLDRKCWAKGKRHIWLKPVKCEWFDEASEK